MTRVIETATGAQILPRPDEPHSRQQATTWSVICCCDADHRTKRAVARELAAGMTIERSDDEG